MSESFGAKCSERSSETARLHRLVSVPEKRDYRKVANGARDGRARPAAWERGARFETRYLLSPQFSGGVVS
jgi:hypothetical protein